MPVCPRLSPVSGGGGRVLSTILTVSLVLPSLVYTSLSESLSPALTCGPLGARVDTSVSPPSVLVIGNVMDFLPLDVPRRPLKLVCSVTSLSIFALRVDVITFSVVVDVVVVDVVVVVVVVVGLEVVVVSAGAVTGILRGGGVSSMLKSYRPGRKERAERVVSQGGRGF